jgi:predicted transposase/invertase (TIGR01784 family)
MKVIWTQLDYRATLEKRRKLTPDDEELIMNLSAAYVQKQKEWKEEGRQEGPQEMAIAMLKENLDLNLIVRTTGLTIQAIKKLQEENNL